MKVLHTALLFAAIGVAAPHAQAQGGAAVKVYAAAVVKEPLTAIAAEFEKATGSKVTLIFDTAGATEQRFRADADAAILITNAALIRDSETNGALKDGAATPLGRTEAGVAVTPKSRKPDISSPELLKAALLSAKRIAVSDPARGATVGTHFMKVIESLGIKDQVMPKVTLARDGVETMKIVVEGGADMGVSQTSEIVQASPDAMVGPFPKAYSLATNFSLWRRTNAPDAVKALAARLLSPEGRAKLAADGVLPPES